MVDNNGICFILLMVVCIGTGFCITQRSSCVCNPPDHLCPSAPLLQVYLQHEKYCTRYYKCTDGRAIEFQCPYGLFFDVDLKMCTCNFTSCYRANPCLQFVDACRCCVKQFDNTGLAPQNFYVCYNDGYALAQTCPLALDPCTNTTVQLEFINNKCEVPPESSEESSSSSDSSSSSESSDSADSSASSSSESLDESSGAGSSDESSDSESSGVSDESSDSESSGVSDESSDSESSGVSDESSGSSIPDSSDESSDSESSVSSDESSDSAILDDLLGSESSDSSNESSDSESSGSETSDISDESSDSESSDSSDESAVTT